MLDSLNHLVRLVEKHRGHRQAEGLGGLEVDEQLKRRRLLHGQLGGVVALQDFPDIAPGAPPDLDGV